MPLLDSTLDIGTNAIIAASGWLSLHSANPGLTGANETTAGRVAAGWSPSSGGDTSTTNKAFTGGAASGPVTHAGIWSAQTGGTFRGSHVLTGDQAFNAAGTYTLNSLTENFNATA